jgi:GDPmannose 4,6-dehydratase
MLDTLIAQSTCQNIKVEIDPGRLRPIDADLQVPDTTKFRTHTGWEPKIPFDTTMKDLLEYWRTRVRRSENFLSR